MAGASDAIGEVIQKTIREREGMEGVARLACAEAERGGWVETVLVWVMKRFRMAPSNRVRSNQRERFGLPKAVLPTSNAPEQGIRSPFGLGASSRPSFIAKPYSIEASRRRTETWMVESRARAFLRSDCSECRGLERLGNFAE